MNAVQQQELRRRLCVAVGRLDAKQKMTREDIDRAIDDLLAAGSAAGFDLPKPNSRR